MLADRRWLLGNHSDRVLGLLRLAGVSRPAVAWGCRAEWTGLPGTEGSMLHGHPVRATLQPFPRNHTRPVTSLSHRTWAVP